MLRSFTGPPPSKTASRGPLMNRVGCLEIVLDLTDMSCNLRPLEAMQPSILIAPDPVDTRKAHHVRSRRRKSQHLVAVTLPRADR